jgi:uncharacterized protein YciI
MNFLIYGRAAVEVADLDTPALDEAHWSYMDTFADRMTARGLTLSPDRATWTGSLHVVHLDDPNAAHDFAVNDPYHRAGLFRGHLIRGFDSLLGRTMWDVTVEAEEVPFLGRADVRTHSGAGVGLRGGCRVEGHRCPPLARRGTARRVEVADLVDVARFHRGQGGSGSRVGWQSGVCRFGIGTRPSAVGRRPGSGCMGSNRARR